MEYKNIIQTGYVSNTKSELKTITTKKGDVECYKVSMNIGTKENKQYVNISFWGDTAVTASQIEWEGLFAIKMSEPVSREYVNKEGETKMSLDATGYDIFKKISPAQFVVPTEQPMDFSEFM